MLEAMGPFTLHPIPCTLYHAPETCSLQYAHVGWGAGGSCAKPCHAVHVGHLKHFEVQGPGCVEQKYHSKEPRVRDTCILPSPTSTYHPCQPFSMPPTPLPCPVPPVPPFTHTFTRARTHTHTHPHAHTSTHTREAHCAGKKTIQLRVCKGHVLSCSRFFFKVSWRSCLANVWGRPAKPRRPAIAPMQDA